MRVSYNVGIGSGGTPNGSFAFDSTAGLKKQPFGQHTLKMRPNSGIQGAIEIVIGKFYLNPSS